VPPRPRRPRPAPPALNHARPRTAPRATPLWLFYVIPVLAGMLLGALVLALVWYFLLRR
jgi:hypothetical protein